MSAAEGLGLAAKAYLDAVEAMNAAQRSAERARKLSHDAEHALITWIIDNQDEHSDPAIVVGDLVIEVRDEYWDRPPGERIRLIRLPARAAS